MKKLFGALALLVLIGGIAYVQMKPETIQAPTEDALTHFIERATAEAKSFDEYDAMGLGGEVDGFTLRKVYPGLLPSDFKGVTAYQGDYLEQDGQLFFSGNAASNSAVIRREGMRTLLQNTSARLVISPHTNEGVDRILEKLNR